MSVVTSIKVILSSWKTPVVHMVNMTSHPYVSSKNMDIQAKLNNSQFLIPPFSTAVEGDTLVARCELICNIYRALHFSDFLKIGLFFFLFFKAHQY